MQAVCTCLAGFGESGWHLSPRRPCTGFKFRHLSGCCVCTKRTQGQPLASVVHVLSLWRAQPSVYTNITNTCSRRSPILCICSRSMLSSVGRADVFKCDISLRPDDSDRHGAAHSPWHPFDLAYSVPVNNPHDHDQRDREQLVPHAALVLCMPATFNHSPTGIESIPKPLAAR